MMKKAAVLGLCTTCASALTAAEPLRLDSRFDASAVQWVTQAGDSQVTGTAFLTLADGSRRSCAGFKVELLPVAEYSNERIRLTYGNNQQGQILLEQHPPKFTPDDPAYHELLLKSQCDAQGVFDFRQVPAGEFYVMVFVIWEEAGADPTPGQPERLSGPARPRHQRGGALMKRIRVEPAARLEVTLGDPASAR